VDRGGERQIDTTPSILRISVSSSLKNELQVITTSIAQNSSTQKNVLTDYILKSYFTAEISCEEYAQCMLGNPGLYLSVSTLPTIETPKSVANVDSNTLRSQLSELRSRCDELILEAASNNSIFNMVDSISFSVERKDNLAMDGSRYCNSRFA